MMAIDFLIFAVLFVSFVINFLALAAFWVTPGLRTTANRFTINLVIINLAGCIILAPTLFLSGGSADSEAEDSNGATSITTGSSESGLSFLSPRENDDSIEFYSKLDNQQMTIRHNGKLVEKEGIIVRRNVSLKEEGSAENGSQLIETIYKCNATYCRQLIIDEESDTLVITEIEEENNGKITDFATPEEHVEHFAWHPLTIRSWTIDMVAALGCMGVLLVVGDTWCAVTDPLRYHSRISGVKSWVLIGLTWTMGILFGALSAFREIDFESDAIVTKHNRYIHQSTKLFSLSSANNIFSVTFSCLYFILIILLPFGFVCGMYWRIISEARENGLRMRQNGSSPLLQSALNLAQGQQPNMQQYSNSLCVHRNSVSSTSSQFGGLQMQIDRQQKKSSPVNARRDSAVKVLLPPISDDGLSQSDQDVNSIGDYPENQNPQQNTQNIILTLQTASGEIKRNYSSRRLELLETSSQDLGELNRFQCLRQVHSSPNLQRCVALPQTLISEPYSPHLLGGHLPQHIPNIQLLRHSFQPDTRHTKSSHQHHHSTLQIPSIQTSPKALSYMSSLRHRLSNASSLFKYREESRAARISILVVIMFLVSYLPFGFLVLLQSRLPSANFRRSSDVAIFMILLANLSSPFIFAYRNKRVRRGIKRLLALDVLCGKSKLQRHNGSSSRSNTNINRTSSRVSTYSTNSGRYLTPQNSVISNAAADTTNAALRPNTSCSTIINFTLNNNLNICESTIDDTNRRQRPSLQRGITIVEQIPLNGCSKSRTKGKLYRLILRNSKKVVCSTVPVPTTKAVPTEV